jgi:hypothetical protein
MAHSPLRMFHQFHGKHMLVSGQGPVKEIAKYLGFKKVTTIEELRGIFPALDAVDHQRRISVVRLQIANALSSFYGYQGTFLIIDSSQYENC